MRKVLFVLIPLLLLGYLLIITLIPRGRLETPGTNYEVLYNQNTETDIRNTPSDHTKQSLNCKSCHSCEYPTKLDPCLITCPREDMVSVYHSPEEGPDVIEINEMSENYTGVLFSHKIHAQMSVITDGCVSCHHYNTTGPVLNCGNCHEKIRSREDVSIPDLKAAYHRQCTSCHKQWSHENGCDNQCHFPAGSTDKKIIKTVSGKTHAKFPEPARMVWETGYNKGKIVTFYHNEHVKLFKIGCADCHSQDNCIKCHDKNIKKDFNKPLKLKKSFTEHHTPCAKCHNTNNCEKCHSEKEMLPFNHGKSSGWPLKAYHSRLDCSKCHGSKLPFKSPDNNCVSCHKNFTEGSFDHKVTGLSLSEGHLELQCRNCHANNDFAKNPVCTECHDDYTYPGHLPGKKR